MFRVSECVRLKSACAATETGRKLQTLDTVIVTVISVLYKICNNKSVDQTLPVRWVIFVSNGGNAKYVTCRLYRDMTQFKMRTIKT